MADNEKKLLYIKIIHTIIWAFYVMVLFYILYAAVFNVIDKYLFIAIGLVIIEGIVLLAFKWRCPLTVLAYRYTDNRDPAFDIFLPTWLAKHNKTIYTILFAIGMVIVIYRIIRGQA
ncbi:MAG TPA: hypothetical protein GXX37_06845 [Clostridiaceae bacterium]|nr:hypothetical protein [Clostridiaceae bacterium]